MRIMFILYIPTRKDGITECISQTGKCFQHSSTSLGLLRRISSQSKVNCAKVYKVFLFKKCLIVPAVIVPGESIFEDNTMLLAGTVAEQHRCYSTKA